MPKTRTRNAVVDERFALRHFGVAADRSERAIHDARDALARVAQAGDEYQRRDALVDVVENLMDASYNLGLAEGHLLHAGRRDPLSVPRYKQVSKLFAQTWEGARARRVANFTDRGRAAFAAGTSAAAGAVIGGFLAGPPGALAGSIVGGGLGPYVFMRDMRQPEELGDAVLGGGVGGLFTPIGAAVGAYLAGDELERAGNRGRRSASPLRRRNGWIGDTKAVEHFLSVVGADRDPKGRYLIGGDPPIYGIGGDEMVVSDATVYYADGRPVPLAAALAETSSGLPVRVFNPERAPNMDPEAAVRRLNEAILEEDWAEAEAVWEDLLEWVGRGGFLPQATIELSDDAAYEWMEEGQLTEEELDTIRAFNREAMKERLTR